MSRSKPTAEFIVGLLLALFFGIALYLRVVLPYDQVFSGDWIKFTGIDAYYQMHFVDNLAHNFPHHMNFDPYFIYPSSPIATSLRFFTWFLGGITWVIGLGSPTQHTVDVVGVYFPAILGALTVFPVYFIGKELFNRWAGVVAAGLIALASGEFLGRSMLGFTDYHVAEVLFSTVVILFLILAIKVARQRQLTFTDFKHRHWKRINKPVIYSLFAGIFLGIYLLTWMGGLLFVFIISVYFIVQFIIDHLKHKSTEYLGPIGIILFSIAMIIYLPTSPPGLYVNSVIIALLIPVVLSGASWLMASKGIKRAYYPLALFGLGLAGLGIFYVINSPLLSSMLDAFNIFIPTEVARTTIEAQPFLFPPGGFSTKVAWGNFTTSFFLIKGWPIPGLSLISLFILICLVIKQVIKQESVDGEKSLLVVWSLVILAATLGQRRFAYYFAVNVALLTGYLSVLVYYVIRYIIDYLGDKNTDYMSWRILEFAGFSELMTQPVESRTRAERRRAKLKKEREARPTINYTSIILWVIVIFFLAFFWNIHWATNTAKQVRFAPSDAWMSSLSWLRENTPEPFGDPNLYYEIHKRLPPRGSPDYPESAYGVTAWWDYGYWISRIAHRLPNANPSQAHVPTTNVASFFLSQDEDSADEIIQKLDSSYIIIDYLTATGKFWAIATWLGKEPTEFFDIYYLPQNKGTKQYIYPEYYRSLSARLYNFDGKAVTPESTLVISYQEKVSDNGETFKEITSEKEFDSYEEAEAYLSSQKSANYRIVSENPFVSPVPLEALKHYKLVHNSNIGVAVPDAGKVPEVKIFEYTGG